MLTCERLKEVLHYNPDTGVFTWLKRLSLRVRIGDTAGHRSRSGYIVIRIDGEWYRAHRLAWLYTRETWPENHIDHIDRDKSNNRISNLRDVTVKENLENTDISVNNTSGHKGVGWHKAAKKWRAQIVHAQNKIHIGLFNTFEDAVQAYESARDRLFTHHRKVA